MGKIFSLILCLGLGVLSYAIFGSGLLGFAVALLTLVVLTSENGYVEILASTIILCGFYYLEHRGTTNFNYGPIWDWLKSFGNAAKQSTNGK